MHAACQTHVFLRWLSSRLLRLVVWWKFADNLEAVAVSIITVEKAIFIWKNPKDSEISIWGRVKLLFRTVKIKNIVHVRLKTDLYERMH